MNGNPWTFTRRRASLAAAAAFLTAVLAGVWLGAVSCAGGEKRAAVFLYTDSDPFIASYVEEILRIAGSDLKIERYYARNSQTIQNEQIEEALARRPDIFLVNPVDRLGMYPLIGRLKEENLPIIFFNREPLSRDLELWERSWYVGARAEQSGQLQAAIIASLFGKPGGPAPLDRNGDGRIQAVILKGEQGHQDAEIRTEQVTKSLAAEGYVLDILATEVANWNEEQAYRKTAALASRLLGRIELVISNNDAMALGAIRSLKDAGAFADDNGDGRISSLDKSWIPVAGIDGIKDARDMIERGYLAGTVYNDYRTQALAVVSLARSVLGLPPLQATSPDAGRIEGGAGSGSAKYLWVDYTPVRQE